VTQQIARLSEYARQFGLTLDSTQCEHFDHYVRAILEAARMSSLTSLETPQDIVDELLLDSLAGASVLRGLEGPAIDVGSGAGVPGLPLAMVDATRRFMLIDATHKKVQFIQRVVGELGLANVEARQARAEELGRDPACREHFGVALAKAVSHLRVLVEWLVPLVQPGGHVLCWKGPAAPREVEEARHALTELGAEVEQVVPYQVPGREPRSIVVLRRITPLSNRYPRPGGQARKHPL